MSPFRRHRDRCLAASQPASAPAEEGGQPLAATDTPAARAAAEMAMRLTLDRRRLKDIQSLERKIDAKREMLPEYAAWIEGMLLGEALGAPAVQGEVLPTIMLWRIDVGDYDGALPLARYVLRHGVALPAHIQRTPATLIAEEIATAALKLLTDRKPFGLDVLLEVEELVAEHDMPDEVRAKLAKAIGFEYALRAVPPDEGGGIAGAERAARQYAIQRLRRALELDSRSGVKTQLTVLEKALGKDTDQGAPPPAETADTAAGATPPDATG